MDLNIFYIKSLCIYIYFLYYIVCNSGNDQQKNYNCQQRNSKIFLTIVNGTSLTGARARPRAPLQHRTLIRSQSVNSAKGKTEDVQGKKIPP